MRIFTQITVFSLMFMLSAAQFEGDYCVLAHNEETGICKPARQCPKVVELNRQGQKFKTCSFISGVHIVCCPFEVTTPKPQPISTKAAPLASDSRISAIKCQEIKASTMKTSSFAGLTLNPVIQEVTTENCDVSTGLIVGGKVTKKGEFPHMCAIGYKKIGEIKFFCGGSLISERFILTAAHCRKFTNYSPFVRLGDQNIQSRSDGLTEVDVPIAEFIKHEEYNKKSRQNDIAVAKLSQDVEFTPFIRPACLWQYEEIDDNKTIATGWGNTDYSGSNSEELMKVQLDLLDNSICVKAFEDDSQIEINDNQVCAGVLEGGKDTCQGDSGGPIEIVQEDNKCAHHIIGITSFGAFCGGKDAASVYTRVSAYLDWIESKVWN